MPSLSNKITNECEAIGTKEALGRQVPLQNYLVLLGASALLLVAGATLKSNTPPAIRPVAEHAYQPTVPLPTPKLQPVTTEHIIKNGDNQWELAKKATLQATGNTDIELVNVAAILTSHLNRHTATNPNILHPGMHISVLSPHAIAKLHLARNETPKPLNQLAADTDLLNNQPPQGSPDAYVISERMLKNLSST